MISNNSMYVSIDWDKIHPNLNGFENVVNRKFDRCGDCKYTTPNSDYPDSLIDCKLYKTFYHISHKKCKRFRGLSAKAIDEIKLHDYEYYPAGRIDIHPRYLIGKITPTQSLNWFPRKDGKKILHNYITNTIVKLEVLL